MPPIDRDRTYPQRRRPSVAAHSDKPPAANRRFEHSAGPRRRNKAASLLGQQLAEFLLDARARQLTDATYRFYRQQLDYFAAYLAAQGVADVRDLTAGDIRAYLAVLQERGLRPNSVHAAARAIRALCHFLEAEGVLVDSPMRNVRMPRLPSEIPPAFTEADLPHLLAACEHTRDKALLLVLLDSGCRASELVALDVGDVDVRSGQVHVRHGKGRKERVVYIGARSRRQLLRYLNERGDPDEDDPLWLSQTTGERLTDAGLRLLLRRLGLRAGVRHCHPHTFRRTFALWSLRSGMNVYALQRLMGHADLQILRRYLALVDEDLQLAHQKYGAVDTALRSH
jgi:site-specific recombinase XerD